MAAAIGRLLYALDQARETLRVPVEEGGGDPSKVTRDEARAFLKEAQAYSAENKRNGGGTPFAIEQ